MSKKMESAYFALDVKDAFRSLMSSWGMIIPLVVFVSAYYVVLFAIDIDNIVWYLFLSASIFASVCFVCAYGVTIFCDIWIKKMGYSEVELEQNREMYDSEIASLESDNMD